ncbi:unnamed protein product [Prunus armeniaca]
MVFVTVCLFEEAGLRLRPSSQAAKQKSGVCLSVSCGLWLVACGGNRTSFVGMLRSNACCASFQFLTRGLLQLWAPIFYDLGFHRPVSTSDLSKLSLFTF